MTEAKIKISANDATKAAFASVSRSFDGLQTKMDGLGLAMLSNPVTAALAAAAAIAALTLESSKAIDEFNDLSEATGASIENISALDRVARETGGGLDTAASILIKFNKVLTDTGKEGSDAGLILKSIGVDAEDLKRIDPAEALRQAAVALAGFADNGDKARAIQILFGKSVEKAAPFLKDLAEKTALVALTSTEAAGEAKKFNEELFRLKADAQDFARELSGPVISGLNNLIGKLAEVKTYSVNPMDFVFNLGASFAGGKGPVKPEGSWGNPDAPELPKLKPPEEDPKKTAKPKDPLAEAKQYLENLQKQVEKALELSTEEQTLLDIQKKRIDLVTPALQKELLATSRLIDLKSAETNGAKSSEAAAKKAADAAVRLFAENQKYLEAVELPFEALNRKLLELTATMDANPLISAETSARLSTEYWREYTASIVDASDKTNLFDEFNKSAAKNIQDQLGQGLYDILDGNFSNIGDSFAKMLQRMVAEAAAAQLSRKLFGDLLLGTDKKTGDSGLIGAAFSAFTGSLFSFDGGGYTGSGTRSGGVDGKGGFVAVLHPDESVIDHSKGPQGSGGNVTVYQNFTVGDVASISMVRQAVAGSEKRIAAGMGRAMTYGGALS